MAPAAGTQHGRATGARSRRAFGPCRRHELLQAGRVEPMVTRERRRRIVELLQAYRALVWRRRRGRWRIPRPASSARQQRRRARAVGVDPLPQLPVPQAAELDIQILLLGLRLGLRLAQLLVITALAQPIFGALEFRARLWVSIADNARAKTRRPPRHRRGSTVSPTFVCDAAEAAPFFRSWELQCLPLRHAVWLPYGRGSVGRRMLSFVRARGRLPRFRAVVSPLASVQQALCLASLQRFSCASTVGTVGTCRYLRYLQLRKISSVTSLWPRSPLGRCSDA